MRHVLLGQDAKTGEDVRIPADAFSTHLHLIGGTGKGKTTAIHTMLHPLLSDPFNNSCFLIIDRLGNFSQELLLWMSSRFCPDYVRERLVYRRHFPSTTFEDFSVLMVAPTPKRRDALRRAIAGKPAANL